MEEPLPAGGSCLLGAMNLAEYVKNREFDFEEFLEDIYKNLEIEVKFNDFRNYIISLSNIILWIIVICTK